ncbi:outer membrane beta-barrel protein [Acidiphilium acidophilum]|uniref:Outer membrane beta-barrel protein n=1 Tax=Acidiphilium acidophilum TaxID=76588 RepID=A0AAW9DNP6_ACIAO|nr:outer membrane beta-barrel protein [Acidiphilium acidophilum]MDX5930242.1 outer membrane beta-barrel protein [Acidiphilium acidophilum]
MQKTTSGPRLATLMATGAALLMLHPATAAALNGPSWQNIDGGPLGPLQISAGIDGYFYGQSGTATDSGQSVAGTKSVGAEIDDFMIEMRKPTGLIQFTLQAAEYTNINLGTNRPKEINGNAYTTGPIRAAFITLAPSKAFNISVGQVNSVEGYESAFAWNNPVALRTVIAAVQNSESRGISAVYNHGKFSGTIVFGDGYDTGVFNYLQFLLTETFDASNSLNLYGGVALGVTGPNAFAYGSGGESAGGANGVGGQGQLAAVNSNLIGAWYTWSHGGLSLTPEAQYQYAKPLHRYEFATSGGVSDDIPKTTSNFATAVFADYQFAKSPYSLGAWVEYATSKGSAAQDAWFVAPNAQLVGLAIAPTWQHRNLYARLNMGYVHLLDQGTPAAGFGNAGQGTNQVVATMEFGLVF